MSIQQVYEECPNCGSEVTEEIQTEHGTRYEESEHVQVNCDNCGLSKYRSEINQPADNPIEV
jgi:uncharacterized Zn finger protein